MSKCGCFGKFNKLYLYSLATLGAYSLYRKRDALIDKGLKKMGFDETLAKKTDKDKVGVLLSKYFDQRLQQFKTGISNQQKEEKLATIPIEIKEFQKSREGKIAELCSKVTNFENIIKNLQFRYEENEKIVADAKSEEKAVYKEIAEIKKESAEKIRELNDKSKIIKSSIDNLMKTINEDYSNYSKTLEKTNKALQTGFFSEHNNYQYQDLKKLDLKGPINKEELIKEINYIRELKDKITKNQFRSIYKFLTKSYLSLENTSKLLTSNLQAHHNFCKAYFDFKHDEYSWMNKENSLNLVISKNKKLQKENLLNSINSYRANYTKEFINTIYPGLQNELKNENVQFMKIITGITKDELLKLENNFDYLKNSFKASYYDFLFTLKFIQNKPNCSDLYSATLNSLLKMSKDFKNDFLCELLTKSNLVELNNFTDKEIADQFYKAKRAGLYSIITKNKSNTFFKVLLSPLISWSASSLLMFYNPTITPIKPSDKNFTKQMKAMKFISFYIKQKKYEKAFYNLQFLNIKNKELKVLESMLEAKIKNEVVLSILDRYLN